MSTATLSPNLGQGTAGAGPLRRAGQAWFLTAVLGQAVFALYIGFFYGRAAVRADWNAWNAGMPHAYVPGETMGNLAVAVHLLLAVLVTVAGVIQLIPSVRRHAAAIHRWNGRIYILAGFVISLVGLYMLWGRGTFGHVSQHLGTTLNAVLIMVCGAYAFRYARARDFAAHRRWALRLFLVMSGVWFSRVIMRFWLLVHGGPVGFDMSTFQGPFLTFLTFAQTLLPLAVLELYLRVQERGGLAARLAVAAFLVLLTVATGLGIYAAATRRWLPLL